MSLSIFGMPAILAANILAQASNDMAWLGPLTNLGVAGVMLVWFMMKNEPRQRSMEASIDRNSKSILLLVISMPEINEAIKSQSRDLLSEVEQAAKSRTH